MAVGPGQSVDRPQATQREVAASLSAGAIGNVDQPTVDYAKKLQAEKAKAGGKSAAFEAAKIDLENKEKKWAGGRGEEAKEAFRDDKIKKEVNSKVDAINKLKQGLELANLDPSRRPTRIKEMKDLGLVDKKADADTLISEACATIANSKMFDVLYPDLAVLTPGQKQIWVESGLALSPVLGDKISTLMGAWQEGVNEFTVIATTQTEQQKNDVATAQAKQKKAQDNIGSIITDTLLIKKMSTVQREAIRTAMEAGDKTAIENVLIQLKGITPAELQDVQKWNENTKTLSEYRDFRAKANPPTTQYDAEIDRLEKLVDQVKYPPGGASGVVIPVKMGDFQSVESAINSAVFTTNLTAYQEQTEAIDNALLQKSPKNDQEQLNLLNRKGQEQSSLSDLENIIDRAMMQTYDVIEADMVDSKIAVEKQQIADAVKAGRMDEAKMYTNRAKRWIEKKGPGYPEEVHTAYIRTDINMIREYGKVGIRLLIARDAGLINPNQYDAVVNHTKSAYLTLAQMDEGAIKQLDNLANKEGVIADYRDTLMKDYLRANKYIKQTSIGRLISYGWGKNKQIQLDADEWFTADFVTRSKFALKPNEWEDLYGHFDEDIRNAIDKNKDAQGFLNKLRSEGVVSEPKWRRLLYMLALMGMVSVPGLGIGAVGGAALGIPGIGAVAGLGAAEAAAIGVGNATKNQIIQ